MSEFSIDRLIAWLFAWLIAWSIDWLIDLLVVVRLIDWLIGIFLSVFCNKKKFVPHRDIKDTSVGSLSQLVSNQLAGLNGLRTHLNGIISYLEKVQRKELPVNADVISNLQDIFNLLPNINAPSFVDSMTTKTNDQLLVVYLSTMVRSILSMHNLIDNKLRSKSEGEKKAQEKADLAAKKGGIVDKDKDKTAASATGDGKKEEAKKDAK